MYTFLKYIKVPVLDFNISFWYMVNKALQSLSSLGHDSICKRINFSLCTLAQNLILAGFPLLNKHFPFPVGSKARVVNYLLEPMHIWNRAGPLWSSREQRSFSVSHFLFFRKWASFSLHSPPWVPRGKFRQLLIRKGRRCKDKGGQSSNISIDLGQDPDSMSRDTHKDVGILHTWEKRYIPFACFRNEYFLKLNSLEPFLVLLPCLTGP